MATSKTTKKRITTVITYLQKTQNITCGETWAIGEPDEKVDLQLSWR